MPDLELFALRGMAAVEPGDNPAELIVNALRANNISLQTGDIVVVAQKIVSKAEGRYRRLAEVLPSQQALSLARETDKDPRLVQLILDESVAVVAKKPGVLIVEHRQGYVHANAGIDHSNIPQTPGDEQVLLLPEDPDASARQLRQALQQHTGADVFTLITDSVGRAWRTGTTAMCIGLSGFEPVADLIGQPDMFGTPLRVSTQALADELACAASLLMGQGAEAIPVVIVRGAEVPQSNQAGHRQLLRLATEDMFR